VEGEHKTPEFLAKNYSGTLPVLELADGTMLAECTAITQYLDALDGRPVLTGRTPLEQGMIHMMSKRAELELLDAISVYFHHATPGLGPQVELYQNPEWGLRQRDKALRGMDYFNTLLEHQPFVAGDSFSMADITVIGGLIFAALVDVAIPIIAMPCGHGMKRAAAPQCPELEHDITGCLTSPVNVPRHGTLWPGMTRATLQSRALKILQ
jgi:glutathione S-transferase